MCACVRAYVRVRARAYKRTIAPPGSVACQGATIRRGQFAVNRIKLLADGDRASACCIAKASERFRIGLTVRRLAAARGARVHRRGSRARCVAAIARAGFFAFRSSKALDGGVHGNKGALFCAAGVGHRILRRALSTNLHLALFVAARAFALIATIALLSGLYKPIAWCERRWYKAQSASDRDLTPTLLLPCSCPTPALLLPYSCPTPALLLPYSCLTPALLLPYSCLTPALLLPYSCPTSCPTPALLLPYSCLTLLLPYSGLKCSL
jgi:hypothetical protein